jgi:23S rRNA (cytosine1962-C5)-methyltransferase
MLEGAVGRRDDRARADEPAAWHLGGLERRVAFLVKASSCVVFEDEHLLVVNKPAGMNTHAPGPFAGEGIYEWLRRREARRAKLAIIHRLDKETSGVMVFGKTTLANRSLTEQFTQHSVKKIYVLLTDRAVKRTNFTVVSSLVRAGEKYASRAAGTSGERAETRFRKAGEEAGRTRLEAEPVTGRTHQIRAQAAAEGFPILGDTLYGGTAAARVCLHSARLTLKHPVTGEEMTFEAAADFAADARQLLREALVDTGETNAYRLIHGAADGWPGWYVERLGEFLLSQSEELPDAKKLAELEGRMKIHGARSVYHKTLTRHAHGTERKEASPKLILGDVAPERFVVRENDVSFEMSFAEGYSTGLFLDQRENRRRILTNRIAEDFPVFENGAEGAEVLNAFAYTCGFSVCAAKAGARAASLDLSRKYLAWGGRNFALNGLDAAEHDFIFGEVFDWLKRLGKKGRAFDAVILDPPTFSQSKERGAFRAEKDYGQLTRAALPVLKPGGVMLASTNAAKLEPEEFLKILAAAIREAGKKIVKQHYAPQPPDFPVSRDEPAYLKTVWLKVG